MLRLLTVFSAPYRQRSLIVGLGMIAAVAVSGCAPEQKIDSYVEKPIAELYDEALSKLETQDYDKAAKAFEDVERQHPYSVWAIKAQLMAAYAYYKDLEFDDAIIAAERFIDLYPANKDVPYAYYIRAMCYYEQISDVARDQKMTLLARESLKDIIKRFPDSEYARDARLKLDLTTDHLAGKEMDIGRYYQQQSDWLAAINRFQAVARNYQTTTHAAEALYRLVEVYTQIGLDEQAREAAAVLGHNYPGSEWYSMAFSLLKPEVAAQLPKTEGDGSWTNSLWPF